MKKVHSLQLSVRILFLILFAFLSIDLSAATYTFTVDQTIAAKGSIWNSLGKFRFAQGEVGYIKVSNTGTTAYVCIDAIKIVAANGDSIRIDNSDAQGVTKVGSWVVTNYPQGLQKWVGIDYLHDGNTAKGTMSVKFNPNVITAGDYEVFVRWVSAANRSNKVPFEIGGVTITPPSAPVNLSVSNLKTTQFTLSWNAVSGNSIIYDVFKDGVFYGTTTSNSINIVALLSNKSYSMTIKAKDVEAGESELSAPLVVNTLPQNPTVNYEPNCGTILSQIYTGRGQQVLVVPGIDDGDDAKNQSITFDAKSLDETKLTIDSVVYHSPNKVAFIYVKDKSQLGTVSITLKVKDNGGVAIVGTDVDSLVVTQTFNITTFKDPGANFVEYDTKSWEPRPTSLDLPTSESYKKILETTTPIESKARDFFWTKMYGYIVPNTTSYYTFQGFSNEGFSFYLNLADGISKDFATLTEMVKDYTSTWISGSTLLEAGKAYYFEAYSKDIVNTQPFWLKWTSTDLPIQLIQKENLSVDFDVTRPSTPSNFKVSNLGVNDITLKWDAATDNKKVKAYLVFVDGVMQKDTAYTTEYLVKGLVPQSLYSIFVVAIDAYQNISAPSKLILTTTYQVDNNAPTIPQNLRSDFATAFGVKLHWDASTDAETKVRGYNVYQGNIKIASNLADTELLINNLEQTTSYVFSVSSVDANYNESQKSAPYSVNTLMFDPNETRDGMKKARLSIINKPLCKFDGFGVGVEYSRTSLLSNNLITYGAFESAKLDTLTNLKWFDKSVVDATLTRITDTHDGGKWCAKVSSLPNGYFRCNVSGLFDKQHTYLLRFDMRANPGYTGNIKVQLKGQFSSIPEFNTAIFTPTGEWKTYELELSTNYSGSTISWYLDFISLSNGEILYDNIQLVNKAAYKAGSPYSEIGLNLLKELKPAAVRWGGIPANLLSFKYCSGKGGADENLSYAQFVNLGNILNAKTYIETGIDKRTDYKTDSTTFRTLIEYLGGAASTTGGAIRQAEGYDNLVANSKGIMLGLGNEVWGSTTHFSPFTGNEAGYLLYGKWARAVSAIIKNAPGYDSKIKTAYSGRHPGLNYGLHSAMLTGDNNSDVDALALDGYMGGNMNLSPEIPLSTSQLDYYKSGFQMMQTQLAGLQSDWKEVLTLTNGRMLPFYFYEGNQTTNSYYGRVGQAISFADYFATAPVYGVPYTAIFTLKGGQYSLIQDEVTFKKTPLFEVTKFINRYCTGTILETRLTTSDKIYSGAIPLSLEPVGCKAYTDSTSYSVALFSRDFENDYKIQLDIPDNIGNSANCKIFTLHANSFNDTEILIDSVSLTNFKDSILINVPKFSLVIVRFDGINQHYNAPLTAYTGMKRVESIKLSVFTSPYLPQITRNGGNVRLKLTILPADAMLATAKWEILDNTTIGAYLKPSTGGGQYVWASGSATGNGKIRIVATTLDGSLLSDTISITISGQGPSAIEEINDNLIQLYPVPTHNMLHLNCVTQLSGNLKITDLNARILINRKIDEENLVIDVSNFTKGIYILHLNTDKGNKIIKFIKL